MCIYRSIDLYIGFTPPPPFFPCLQVIAGRYVVIQYLGSGTFCHTVRISLCKRSIWG